VKSRAALKCIPFDLTHAWFVAKIEGKCPLTGRDFDLSTNKGRNNPNAPSVDRIDPNGGYVQSNCRVIVKIANLAKNIFSDEVLMSFATDLLSTISSQALVKASEGSETRAKARRPKRVEAHSTAPLR
jgi:hypothetical protein